MLQQPPRKAKSRRPLNLIRIGIDNKECSNRVKKGDFLIYNKLNKEIVLVVEVDGSQHREEIQAARDRRKDRLLADAGIKILRLTTTSIECKEKIVAMLS